MAQFKDIVVSGAARIIGTLYAENIRGNLQGTATNADTATYDTQGNAITSYIHGISIEGRVISYTKGDGSTASITVPETQVPVGTDLLAGATKLYGNTGTATDGTITQQKLTELFADKLASTGTAAAATKDGSDQNIASTYIKALSSSGNTVTVTKGDGTTSTFTTQDTTYTSGDASSLGLTKLYSTKGLNTDGTMSQDALNTEFTAISNDKLDKSAGITGISASGTTVTLTKGDGSTSTITTQDTTYGYATTAVAGITQLTNESGNHEDIAMSQKGVSDLLSSKAGTSQAVSSFSVDGTTVTYTKADGSTGSFNTQDTTYDQADTNTLGLVKLATSTGQSTATVMNQKAVTDELGNTLVNSTHSNGTVTFTKGDGSTFSFTIPSASPASSEAAGIAKLYNNLSSSATDGAPTQNAVVEALDGLNTSLTTLIGNIFSVELYDDIDDLPDVGTPKVFYLVANSDEDENNNYDEYIWIQDIDEVTEEDNGYYELFGSVSLDLSQYYTSSEVDDAISSATDNCINAATVSGTTVTFTKGDSSTFAFQTQDTTYTNFGLSQAGLVPGTSAGQTNYVLSGNGWVEKANAAVNADSATYATNAGTATYAENAASATNASTANYATNAGSATSATNASSAGYATNAATATNAVNADTAAYATNAGSATYAENAASATNASTADYATNAGTATHASSATNASTADYATNAGTAAHATSATYDSAGNSIAARYISGVNITGTTVTFTRGDGSTFSYTTQDNNTTYANVVFATSSTNGTAGLVPAPTNAQVNYVLTGGGWVAKVQSAVNADTATYATNAGTATYATNAGSATYATSAASISSDFEFDCGLES